jgi:hypothetical protein
MSCDSWGSHYADCCLLECDTVYSGRHVSKSPSKPNYIKSHLRPLSSLHPCIKWKHNVEIISADLDSLSPKTRKRNWFLKAFANLRKAAISFVMSVRLSVCPHGTIRLAIGGFSWNLILRILRKSIEKIQVSLNSDSNNGYFTWRPMYIYDTISANSS